MNFPYTKDRLHNLHDEHYKEEANLYVKEIVDYISQQIISKAIVTSKKLNDGALIVIPAKHRQLVFYFKDILRVSSRHLELPRQSYVPEIISELEKRFPDSLINVDPLSTYVIVNWA